MKSSQCCSSKLMSSDGDAPLGILKAPREISDVSITFVLRPENYVALVRPRHLQIVCELVESPAGQVHHTTHEPILPRVRVRLQECDSRDEILAREVTADTLEDVGSQNHNALRCRLTCISTA